MRVTEEKNRQNGIVQNRIPFERFVRLFAVIEIVLVFLYAKRFATFSVYGSRIWVLVIIVSILAVGSLVLSWKAERNWVSLISGTLMPVLVYEAISMWKYSVVIRIIVLAGCFVSVAVGFFWAVKNVNRIKHIRSRREVFVIKAARVSRIICCLVLLGACVCGKVLISSHYTISYGDIAYSQSESYNNIPDYENSLPANIATVAKLDPDGEWRALPLEEKIEVLETIICIECRYLGMQDSAPALELAYLEEGLLGQYDSEKDVVTLSYNYVVDSEAGGYSVIQVLCHELYHRYQHYQVKLLQAIRDNSDTAKYANLLLLDTAGIYEDEYSNYISPDDDSAISYYMYSSQRLERDAEKYSNASVVDYYEQICSYLKTN